jgi:hypothetical protein
MAVSILDTEPHLHTVRHDLESFYWILVWITLRFLSHDHPEKKLACTHLFDTHDNANHDHAAAKRKREWLKRTDPLTINGNKPFSSLLSNLTDLCKLWVDEIDGRSPEEWYREFMAIFDDILAMEGWPEDDGVMDIPIPSIEHGGKPSKGHLASLSRKRKSDSSQIKSQSKRFHQSLPVTLEDVQPTEVISANDLPIIESST